MDPDELNAELAWAIGEAFLRGLHYRDDDGERRCPYDIYNALENRRAIMRNFNWDIEGIEKEHPELLRPNDLWEDNGEYINCCFDFGEYPTVPRWVERFGAEANDCSPQTHYSLDDEYALKNIFGDLFSDDPGDKKKVLDFLDLLPPELSNE